MFWFKGVTLAIENRHTFKMCLGNRFNMWRMSERENLIIANFLTLIGQGGRMVPLTEMN